MKQLELKTDGPFSGEQLLYTLIEVAEILKVNRQTIYRLVHSGAVPHVRVGDCYRISGEVLGRWTRGELDHLQTPPRYRK